MATSVSAASRHRAAAVAIVVICAAVLAGCAVRDAEPVPTGVPTSSAQPSPTPTPTPDPVFVPGGTAGQNRPYFEFVIRGVLAQTPQPTTAALVDALSASGFVPATIEVTADSTPVGERADSILVGIPIDGQCLLGQIIDGELVSQLADVLGTGRCLVGRPASLD